MTQRWRHAGPEPDIKDLLSDPIAALLRARDGLTRRDVERAVASARGQHVTDSEIGAEIEFQPEA